MKNFYYITDLTLPSDKAQAVHIFKMIDNFQDFSKKVFLICPFNHKDNNFKKIKKDYNLHNKKKIIIYSVFKKKTPNSFVKRMIFAFKTATFLKKEKGIVLTRSIISSIIFSILNINHFLEIHQEIKGLSKIFMINLGFINSKKIIKIIFISKGLAKFYLFKKTNNIILHDACDIRDFIKKKPSKKIKKIYYIGSFYKGRGIDIIEKLASKMPDINFYAYGKRNEKKFSTKNLKFFKIIKYSKVRKILKKADLLLMPYQSKISINSENFNDDISKFISPLKMFEYLATGIPILSSNIKVLREKLIHNKNCVLVDNYEDEDNWFIAINKLKNNFEMRKKIYTHALRAASNNTWRIRVKKLIKIDEEFYSQ